MAANAMMTATWRYAPARCRLCRAALTALHRQAHGTHIDCALRRGAWEHELSQDPVSAWYVGRYADSIPQSKGYNARSPKVHPP